MENTHIKTEEPSVTSNSETATVAATSSTDNNTIAVTSSSPTPSTSAFQPYQQFHEAVLAAVNSNATLSNTIFSAAVAAATANNNVAIHPHPQQFEQATGQQVQPLEQSNPPRRPATEMDQAKKESVRASNRERKKKWRIHNEERNKDNDLRCRVNKRANKLYGPADSPQKQKWVKEEFEKRRQKRMDKERRKHIVNNVLSVPNATSSESPNVTTDDNHINENNTDSNVSMLNGVNASQIQNFYTPLPQIDTATAAKLLDFPSDLQRQLLEQLNNSMMALTNGIAPPPAEQNHEENGDNSNSVSANNTEAMDTSFENSENNNNASANAAAVAAANEALQQVIAQGLSTNTTSTTSSGHNSPMQYTATTSASTEILDTKEAKPEEAEKKEDDETKIKEEAAEEKKPEYPMDAVLTLMQLNAGWRQ